MFGRKKTVEVVVSNFGSQFKYPLGVKAKDLISGVEGIIIYRAEYLNGCRHYGIKPPAGADGKDIESISADENTIELTGEGLRERVETRKSPASPTSDGPRADSRMR